MNKRKRFLSAVLAVAMTASLSVTAFAATTVPTYDTTLLDDGTYSYSLAEPKHGKISVSNAISQKTETFSFQERKKNPNYRFNEETYTDNGQPEYIESVVQRQITYTVIPVGASLEITSESGYHNEAPGIYAYQKNASGIYELSTMSGNIETETISENAGKLIRAFTGFHPDDDSSNDPVFSSAWFLVNASATAVTPAKPADTTKPTDTATPAATNATYKSDTGKHLDVNVNGVYQFKITSLNGKKPAFHVAGKAFTVTYNGKKGNDYFYLVKATGKVGQYGGVYINGEKTASTTISIKNNVKSDTGAKLTVKPGKVYQFKLTAGQKPAFVAGNPKAFTVTYNGKKGNDYFYLVKAVGKSGQSTGLYINGSKTPSTIAYIGY